MGCCGDSGPEDERAAISMLGALRLGDTGTTTVSAEWVDTAVAAAAAENKACNGASNDSNNATTSVISSGTSGSVGIGSVMGDAATLLLLLLLPWWVLVVVAEVGLAGGVPVPASRAGEGLGDSGERTERCGDIGLGTDKGTRRAQLRPSCQAR